MAIYQNLIDTIANNITTNGNNEVTASVMRTVLNSMVNVMGANATYGGVAHPNDNPGTPDAPVVYIASDVGTYPNFGGITLASCELAILKWDTSSWTKESITYISDIQEIYDAEQDALDAIAAAIAGLNIYYTIVSGYNIQLKDGSANALYPITKSSNVLMTDGSTLDEEFALPSTINYAQSTRTMNSSGAAITYANMYLSGFVDVSDCIAFWLTNPLTINTNNRCYVLCFYTSNSEDTYISSGTVSMKGTGQSYTVTCRAIPSGAKYMRISSRTNFPFTMYKVKTIETIVDELNESISADVATSKLADMELQNLLNPSTCASQSYVNTKINSGTNYWRTGAISVEAETSYLFFRMDDKDNHNYLGLHASIVSYWNGSTYLSHATEVDFPITTPANCTRMYISTAVSGGAVPSAIAKYHVLKGSTYGALSSAPYGYENQSPMLARDYTHETLLIGYRRALVAFENIVFSENFGNKPFFNKNIFCCGDSQTYQGRYFYELLKGTGCQMVGNTGYAGNGLPIRNMSYMILTSGFYRASDTTHLYEFVDVVPNADIILVYGCGNDWYQDRPIGAYTDEPPTVAELETGTLPDTFYASLHAIYNTMRSLNNTAKIVFASRPERNAPQSEGETFTKENHIGVTLYDYAMAMQDFCMRMGCGFCDVHSKAWDFGMVSQYCSDGVHPEQAGADMIGRVLASYINSL